MQSTIIMEIEMPAGMESFQLPAGVHHRLQDLLDRQDEGKTLTPAEHNEATGLVELSEWLSLLRLRAQRIVPEATS